MAKELHENKDTEERLILVGIELEDKDSPSAMAVEACLDELEELVNTAGATAVARTIQRREKVHPAHYLGKRQNRRTENDDKYIRCHRHCLRR